MKTLNVAFDACGGFKRRDNIFKGWEGFGGIKHFRGACQGLESVVSDGGG